MSEIFNYLNRGESKHRKELLAEAKYELHPQPVEKEAVANDSIPAELLESGGNLGGAGTFDLSAADHKFRSILDPFSLVGEQLRLLRSKLDLMQRQRGIRTLLVTSAIPKEGKTFTASGLAGVFAQQPGKRILLIDADMRKPASGKSMGLNGSSGLVGLSQVLSREVKFHDALLRATSIDFYFLPSGPPPANPSELLGFTNLEQMLKTAAEDFDWVVLDSPPVLTLSDATLIAPLVNAVLLVVHADSTPVKLAIKAVEQIGRERICGIVMNRQHQVHSSKYYYRYYNRNPKEPGGAAG
jgi:capsular exopolysaccharide synthesis family protein